MALEWNVKILQSYWSIFQILDSDWFSAILQQQQQQQHTLLTFPKGAFQRQCYKNNPITIKNPIYN